MTMSIWTYAPFLFSVFSMGFAIFSVALSLWVYRHNRRLWKERVGKEHL